MLIQQLPGYAGSELGAALEWFSGIGGLTRVRGPPSMLEQRWALTWEVQDRPGANMISRPAPERPAQDLMPGSATSWCVN